jgi:hypothetical protein
MLNNAINNEMTVGLGLPPFLINNLICKGDKAMTKSILEQSQSKRNAKRLPIEKGMRFGCLTIIKEIEPCINPQGQKLRKVEARCDCGNVKGFRWGSLNNGHTRSCGCLQKEIASRSLKTHGLSNHPLYRIWDAMHQRCSNPNRSFYKDYGGRGIKVCDAWDNDFEVFYKWAISNGWESRLLLDRIDVNDGYYAENCRFVDDTLNAINKRLLSTANTSGYRGVTYDRTRAKWSSKIGLHGKTYNLGRFATAKEAAMAYDLKAQWLDAGHPLNFP